MESKEKILKAAIEIFSEKGRHGARMEEIAARADINKAMLYYFYRSRENLFKAALMRIFEQVFTAIETEVTAFLERDVKDPVEFLKMIVRVHFQVYSKNVHFPRLLLQAMVNTPGELKEAIEEVHAKWRKNGCCHRGPEELIRFIDDNIARGIFRKVDAKQIMASIIGMNMIYYATKPITETLLGFTVKDEKKFLEERQESNIDLLLNGIMATRSIS